MSIKRNFEFLKIPLSGIMVMFIVTVCHISSNLYRRYFYNAKYRIPLLLGCHKILHFKIRKWFRRTIQCHITFQFDAKTQSNKSISNNPITSKFQFHKIILQLKWPDTIKKIFEILLGNNTLCIETVHIQVNFGHQ